MLSEIYISFNGNIGANKNARLQETMKNMKKEDKLIITMDSNNAGQTRMISGTLERNGFEISSKGDHTGHYRLIAQLRD